MAFVAQQLKGRRKAKEKLPTWHANTDVVFPASISLEQCTSELVAAYKADLFSGERAADLTGGFGVDSAFLAKRFRSLDYVERNPELAAIVAWNARIFGLSDQLAVHSGDFVKRASML